MSEVGSFIKEVRTEKGMSKRALGEAADISHTEVHRIENGQRLNPSPPVLRAIANALGIQYEQLMKKAGYINNQDELVSLHRNLLQEDKFIDLLTPKLFKEGWIAEQCPPSSIGDMIARKNDINWTFTFKYIEDSQNATKTAQNLLFRIYGELAVYDGTKISKFTTVINNEKAFGVFLKYLPVNLSMKISVMLVDFEENKIVEEKELN